MECAAYQLAGPDRRQTARLGVIVRECLCNNHSVCWWRDGKSDSHFGLMVDKATHG